MGLLAALDYKGVMNGFKKQGPSGPTAPPGLALPQQTSGPLGGSGMPAMPGQSPLGMSLNAPPGNSLAASGGQRKSLY